jgi:hypothetical protein
VKRLVPCAVALAALLAACAPSASTPSPTPIETAEPAATPGRTVDASPQVTEAPAAAIELPTLPAPLVKLDRRTFAIGAAPGFGFVSSTPEGAAQITGNLAGIDQGYTQLLNRYANLTRASATEQAATHLEFESSFGSGAFAEMVRGWLAIRYADETKSVTIADFALDRAYSKPWGRVALVDGHFGIVVRSDTRIGIPSEERHDVRVRISVAGNWQIIDVFDATAGRWLAGDTPQYSPLAIENEVTTAIGRYLQGESYLYGAPVPDAGLRATTAFQTARAAALTELRGLYESGKLRGRRFEDVSVRVVKFDPATYLGDGVVTVTTSGTLVETYAEGAKRSVRFTQPLRFLRTFAVQGAAWTAVDAQEPDGTWDSGGDLALEQIDGVFG